MVPTRCHRLGAALVERIPPLYTRLPRKKHQPNRPEKTITVGIVKQNGPPSSAGHFSKRLFRESLQSEIFFADSRHFVFVQVADLISTILMNRDKLAAGWSESEWMRSQLGKLLWCHAVDNAGHEKVRSSSGNSSIDRSRTSRITPSAI
jgi:hypothetical protein